jgi:hypothetical protein
MENKVRMMDIQNKSREGSLRKEGRKMENKGRRNNKIEKKNDEHSKQKKKKKLRQLATHLKV